MAYGIPPNDGMGGMLQPWNQINRGVTSVSELTPGNFGGQQPQPYKPPSYALPFEQIQMDPSYGFRLNQGLSAMENSAAAKGGLMSSGTFRDLNDYAQGFASQEYGNAWNRAFQDRQFGADQYQNAFGRNMAQNQFDFDRFRDDRNFGYQGYRDQASDWRNMLNNQADLYGGLADIGPRMAGYSGDLAMGGAESLGKLYLALSQLNAQQTMGKSDANRDFLGDLFSLGKELLPLLVLGA